MTREEIVRGAFASIQQGSKSFRAASRLFDPVTRERVWMLYCWCRHCDDVCDGQTLGHGRSSPGRVSELQDKTRDALAGRYIGELPFDALAQLAQETPIPATLIEDHLAGFILDERGWQPQTEADLARYCYHVAGAVGGTMAVVMGVPADEEETLARAADLGIAFQLSNIARDIGDDWQNGRCYLPQEWLTQLGVRREDLLALEHRPALVTMVERLVERIGIYEESARRGVRRLPFRSRLAVLTALRIYGAIGRRVGMLGAAAWDRRVTIGKSRKLAYLVPSFAEAVARRRD